jgi:hypothetical protein
MLKGISVSAVPPCLRSLIGDRRGAGRRRRVARDVRLPVAIEGAGPGSFKTLRTRTQDISEGGLSVITDGDDVFGLSSGWPRELCLVLSVPGRPVRVRVWPAHSRRLYEGSPERGCVVGLRITEMISRDRRRLREFLQSIR